MIKRGNAILVILISFVFFSLFVFGVFDKLNVTGYAIIGNITSNDFGVDELIFTKVNILPSGEFEPIGGDVFYQNDLVGCGIDYTATSPEVNFDVGFYSEESSIENPEMIYTEVLSSIDQGIVCDVTEGACLVYYNVTDYVSGKWRCFVKFSDQSMSSDILNMQRENVAVQDPTADDPLQNAAVLGQTCYPSWDCDWTECSGGRQSCPYFDRNNCGVSTGKPVDLIRSCLSEQSNSQTVGASTTNLNLDPVNKKVLTYTGFKRIALIAGLGLGIVIFLALIIYLIFKLTKKKSVGIQVENKSEIENKPQVVNTSSKAQVEQIANFDEIRTYIENSLNSGTSYQNIKNSLVSAGWKEVDIDSSYRYINLKRFVKEKLNSGFDKQRIMESLKAKGWKEDLINSVFRDLNS